MDAEKTRYTVKVLETLCGFHIQATKSVNSFIHCKIKLVCKYPNFLISFQYLMDNNQIKKRFSKVLISFSLKLSMLFLRSTDN